MGIAKPTSIANRHRKENRSRLFAAFRSRPHRVNKDAFTAHGNKSTPYLSSKATLPNLKSKSSSAHLRKTQSTVSLADSIKVREEFQAGDLDTPLPSHLDITLLFQPGVPMASQAVKEGQDSRITQMIFLLNSDPEHNFSFAFLQTRFQLHVSNLREKVGKSLSELQRLFKAAIEEAQQTQHYSWDRRIAYIRLWKNSNESFHILSKFEKLWYVRRLYQSVANLNTAAAQVDIDGYMVLDLDSAEGKHIENIKNLKHMLGEWANLPADYSEGVSPLGMSNLADSLLADPATTETDRELFQARMDQPSMDELAEFMSVLNTEEMTVEDYLSMLSLEVKGTKYAASVSTAPKDVAGKPPVKRPPPRGRKSKGNCVVKAVKNWFD
ncbi:hypothetical protein EJ08DRAFT_693951 [Tothia fuscella]|uniref:Uncharacterized protein n=1 Tax=Tothia fuscella TaxID=1048955 RepID=A0A9P4NX00_9PEZI|nr:hypothetical protein EJ08DRAFT_693951 [Tothia fuscella]